jgi:hypothetical protein
MSASTIATVNMEVSSSEKLEPATTVSVGMAETAVAASGVPGRTLSPPKVTLRSADGLKVGKN